MTPHQGIAVGVRLFAIWLILNALSTGYFALIATGGNGLPDTLTFGVVLTLLWAVVAVALWNFPQVVARKLLSQNDSARAPDSGRSSVENWFAVGCALIGIWLIVSSFPSLVANISNSWPSLNPGGFGVYSAVRIALGAGLLVGSRRLQALVRWSRYAGTVGSKETGRAQ